MGSCLKRWQQLNQLLFSRDFMKYVNLFVDSTTKSAFIRWNLIKYANLISKWFKNDIIGYMSFQYANNLMSMQKRMQKSTNYYDLNLFILILYAQISAIFFKTKKKNQKFISFHSTDWLDTWGISVYHHHLLENIWMKQLIIALIPLSTI